MAAVATALVGDRYAASSTSSSASSSSCSSSSFSSSSGDTSEEDSSSSWSSSSSSSSTWSSSASSSPSTRKKKKRDVDNKKKKKKKKKRSNKSKSTALIAKRKKTTKSSKSLVGRGVDHDDDNEVGSMLLLGAELLKEVEEAAASSAAAMATSTAAAAAALTDASAEPLPLPIGHYVVQGGPQNRAVLLEQVMSSVPAAQWQAILPPVLKEMNSAELKQLCLQQLQLLSDSAILNIINGGGDQGPAAKAVWPETGETERSQKKRSKKSKKRKSKKGRKSERSEPTLDDDVDDVDDESSGKTLMELLELEMRARAIKALLKKEEEGQGDDEWPDDVVAFDALPATPVHHHHRPLNTGEDSSSYVDKHKPSRHAGHQRRPSVDPVPPTHCSRRPASLHQQTDDADCSRRDRHSSAKQENDQGLNKIRQPRHYRHRHHERSGSPVRRAEPSTVVTKTEETKEAAQSPSRSGRVKSERRDNAKGGPEKCDGRAQVATEEVEYEEEGIQEVDIELGSGSDDDANSARL